MLATWQASDLDPLQCLLLRVMLCLPNLEWLKDPPNANYTPWVAFANLMHFLVHDYFFSFFSFLTLFYYDVYCQRLHELFSRIFSHFSYRYKHCQECSSYQNSCVFGNVTFQCLDLAFEVIIITFGTTKDVISSEKGQNGFLLRV